MNMLLDEILAKFAQHSLIDYALLARELSIRKSALEAAIQQLCQMGYLTVEQKSLSQPLPMLQGGCKTCPYAQRCEQKKQTLTAICRLTEKGKSYLQEKKNSCNYAVES